MPNYPKITAKELFEVIQKLDFYYSHTTSSQIVYRKRGDLRIDVAISCGPKYRELNFWEEFYPDEFYENSKILVLPNYRGEKIGTGLLTKIIEKDLEISKEEFFKLL